MKIWLIKEKRNNYVITVNSELAESFKKKHPKSYYKNLYVRDIDCYDILDAYKLYLYFKWNLRSDKDSDKIEFTSNKKDVIKDFRCKISSMRTYIMHCIEEGKIMLYNGESCITDDIRKRTYRIVLNFLGYKGVYGRCTRFHSIMHYKTVPEWYKEELKTASSLGDHRYIFFDVWLLTEIMGYPYKDIEKPKKKSWLRKLIDFFLIIK